MLSCGGGHLCVDEYPKEIWRLLAAAQEKAEREEAGANGGRLEPGNAVHIQKFLRLPTNRILKGYPNNPQHPLVLRRAPYSWCPKRIFRVWRNPICSRLGGPSNKL